MSQVISSVISWRPVLIIVCTTPVPWIVIALSIVIVLVHFAVPAGITIVSPLAAKAMAVLTLPKEGLAALITAAPAWIWLRRVKITPVTRGIYHRRLNLNPIPTEVTFRSAL